MKNTNYESLSSSNSSFSTDSLEIITRSISDVAEESKSIIQEYSSDQNLHVTMKKNSRTQKQISHLTTRQRIPIRKRSCTRLTTHPSNYENVSVNKKVDQETNTAIPVYPEIIVKHCHDNQVIEKVIPAVDYTIERPKTKPKSCIEIVRYGEKNGKLNILPIGNNQKSYLEIFQSRHGIIKSPTAEGNCSRVDVSPRGYGDVDQNKHNNNNSLYSKCLEKSSQIRYTSHASSINSSTLSANSPDSLSRASSLLHTSSGLTSVSEQTLSMKPRTPRTSKTLTATNNKKNGLKVIKSEGDSTKEKLEKFIRQREYGQTVSNRNRIKIIQNHIRNSELKPAAKEPISSKRSIIKREESSPRTVPENQEKNKNFNKHIKKVDMSINTDDLYTFTTKQKTYKNSKLDPKKIDSPKFNTVHNRGTLKTLQHRHLKDQEIIEKLRNTTL